jgi:hypothetical protein
MAIMPLFAKITRHGHLIAVAGAVFFHAAALPETAATAIKADRKKTPAKNCALRKPSKNSVTLPTHAIDLLIYPDAAAVDAHYTGCQNIWLSDGHLLAQAEYKNGVVQSYKGWEPDGAATMRCIYKDRSLNSDKSQEKDCPPFDFFPINREGRAK